jgi:predicted transcriptional regulator
MAESTKSEPDLSPIGDRETEAMQALWSLGGPATVSEVQAYIAERGRDLAYTTVQTMLNRLEAKGQVRRERSRLAHRYFAAMPRSAVVESAIGRVINRFFKGSPVALASHLLSDLDEDEIDRVEALLEQARRERTR